MDLNGLYSIFSLYEIHPNDDGEKYHLAGRFLINNGKLTHLEDHFGHLERILPEGPITDQLNQRMRSLENNPYYRIVNDGDVAGGEHPELIPEIDLPKSDDNKFVTLDPEIDKSLAQPDEQARPPSVFEYFRQGMIKPAIIEIYNGKFLMNGHLLTEAEVKRVLFNVQNGLASLKYRTGTLPD